MELNIAFVHGYCELYLAGPDRQNRPPISVDHDYYPLIVESRLEQPVILAYVGEGEGLVSLNEDVPESDYVLIDGNHRMMAATRRGRTLDAYILDAINSSRYKKEIE